MIHHTLLINDEQHYGVNVNHDKSCVLLQLGDGLEQVRVQLTGSEVDKIVFLLLQKKKEITKEKMDDQKINHMIATEMLDWGFSEISDTYWLEFGVQIGTKASFNPLTNEFQGNKVISTLNLPCTTENLREYVLSLTDQEKKEMRNKYGPIQRQQAGIKYYT